MITVSEVLIMYPKLLSRKLYVDKFVS